MQTPIYKHERISLLKKAIKLGLTDVVYFDLETSPIKLWSHYIGSKTYINHKQIDPKYPKRIITIQYYKEGWKKPKYLCWDWKKGASADAAMIEHFITKVVNHPNVLIIGQNHKAFDHKTLNERAALLQLTPPETVLNVDVLQLSRSSFRYLTHKLDHRSELYGFGGKIKMEWEDWINTTEGCKVALKKMAEYGLKDVYPDLHGMFWRELPYYTQIPAKLEKILRVVKESELRKNNPEGKSVIKTAHCENCRKKHLLSTKIINKKCFNCNSKKYVVQS